MLAKICGVRTLDAAVVAADNGADYIGIILVPGRKRTIDHAVAKQISGHLRSFGKQDRPLLVGVFRNAPLDEILALKQELGLDVVQLHGSEPAEWVSKIPGPVIRRLSPGSPNFVENTVETLKIPEASVLIDSEQGGDGAVVDWSPLVGVAQAGGSYILAGGLTPENVKEALQQPGCIGVDVSSGVEDVNGDKDFAKIRAFLSECKAPS